MRNPKPRSSRFARSIMLVFLTASLSGEALHTHEEHNPHGNRRERIEELRQRLFETELHRTGRRLGINGGRDPVEPETSDLQLFVRRRRDSSSKEQQNRNMPG